MWVVVGAVRLAAILALLLVGLMLSLIIGFLPQWIRLSIIQGWYRFMLFLIGIRCSYKGEAINTVGLVVSNHISWADIIVIGARWPFIFLAMQDVARWPVVGWLSRRVGTLFIERGKGAPGAIVQVAAVLDAGQHVVLFPEGRTTPGLSVIRFQPRIFQAAVDANVAAQPLVIFYCDADRSPSQGSRISYANEPSFIRSAWRTIAGPTVNAEVRVFPPIGPLKDRQQMSSEAEKIVAKYIETKVSSTK